MTSKPLTLTAKQESFIAQHFAAQKPNDVMELLSVLEGQPRERDHRRINEFFLTFCRCNEIPPADFQGPIYKGQKSDSRKRFIAAMVRIYLPHLYNKQARGVRLDRGFVKELAGTLKLTKPCIAKVVREVVVQEELYPEFGDAVDEVTNKLKLHE